jgi:CRISPR-associated protein Csx17
VSQPPRPAQTLAGLRAEPLASYLAGLGLIRVLAEQADTQTTAAWTDSGLAVTSAVADIAAWLAERYEPTPVLSPWNNGSGFGLKDKEPKRTLDSIRAHPSPRFAALREAIPVAERVAAKARSAGWLTDGAKPGDKARVVQEFRNRCPDALLPWIDAAVVLTKDGEFYPPLLGTGGNDGRLDFSTNFHQRLLDVLDTTEKGKARSLAWARDLLGGTQDQPLADAAVGQFDPAAAGGPGSSPFGAAASRVNPWGYVLLVEGALLFAASAVRRNEHGSGRAAIPFTVYASPDGSDSGAQGEESRGEIWAPVWHTPFTFAEVQQLFSEARASWRGHPARRAAQFYAATRTLGVARGVDTFIRYGLHKRNGRSFAAVPVDRVNVYANPDIRLVASVEDWPARLSSDAPGAIRTALRGFEAAQLRYARTGRPEELGEMLAALTTLEQGVSRSGRMKDSVPVRRPASAQPFLDVLTRQPPVRDSPEFRVAAGIASCATLPGPDQRAPARTMRQILLAIDPPPSGTPTRIAGRWRDSPLVAGFGVRSLYEVLAEVLIWRCRTAAAEADRQSFRGVPTFRRGVPVPAADLHAFALGQLDDAALELWLRACLALDWGGVRTNVLASDEPPVSLDATLALLHPFAAGLDFAKGEEVKLGLQPDWPNRLSVGQVDAVHSEAVSRLRQGGWRAVPYLPHGNAGDTSPWEKGSRLAAALVPQASGPLKTLSLVATRPQRETPGEQMPAVTVLAATPNSPAPAARSGQSPIS